MDSPIVYDLIDQLERVCSSLEKLSSVLEPKPGAVSTFNPEPQPHLSLFLEALPGRHYNCLRRKLLPPGLAAKILGLSPGHLSFLTKTGRLKSAGNRYDLLSLLMWLDDELVLKSAA